MVEKENKTPAVPAAAAEAAPTATEAAAATPAAKEEDENKPPPKKFARISFPGEGEVRNIPIYNVERLNLKCLVCVCVQSLQA